MAKQSGFKLNVPSEEAANEVIDEVDKKIRSVIKEYSGKPNGPVTGHYMMLTVDSSGGFIKRLEENMKMQHLKMSQLRKFLNMNMRKCNRKLLKKQKIKMLRLQN